MNRRTQREIQAPSRMSLKTMSEGEGQDLLPMPFTLHQEKGRIPKLSKRILLESYWPENDHIPILGLGEGLNRFLPSQEGFYWEGRRNRAADEINLKSKSLN